MTKREFIKKYHPVTYGGLKQFSWDLFEEIEETFNLDLDLSTKIGSISYKISTALEVYNPKTKDYDWLTSMYNDIHMVE